MANHTMVTLITYHMQSFYSN